MAMKAVGPTKTTDRLIQIHFCSRISAHVQLVHSLNHSLCGRWESNSHSEPDLPSFVWSWRQPTNTIELRTEIWQRQGMPSPSLTRFVPAYSPRRPVSSLIPMARMPQSIQDSSSPMFAGAAMALSSFTVVANALLVNTKKLK